MDELKENDLSNSEKEKRAKKFKANREKKKSLDKFDRLMKKHKAKRKDSKAFRKNQKYFEFDYEEDFYEPEKY